MSADPAECRAIAKRLNEASTWWEGPRSRVLRELADRVLALASDAPAPVQPPTAVPPVAPVPAGTVQVAPSA